MQAAGGCGRRLPKQVEPQGGEGRVYGQGARETRKEGAGRQVRYYLRLTPPFPFLIIVQTTIGSSWPDPKLGFVFGSLFMNYLDGYGVLCPFTWHDGACDG